MLGLIHIWKKHSSWFYWNNSLKDSFSHEIHITDMRKHCICLCNHFIFIKVIKSTPNNVHLYFLCSLEFFLYPLTSFFFPFFHKVFFYVFGESKNKVKVTILPLSKWMNKICVRYGKAENKLFMLLEQYLSDFKKIRHELDK